MSPALKSLVRRIDAMSVRERLFLFLSLAMLLLAAADQLVIARSLALQRAWHRADQQTATELNQLRNELQALNAAGASAGPQQGQAELTRLREARDALRQRLQASPAEGSASSPAGLPTLPTLLAQVLQRHARVSVVQLATQAPAEAASGAATLAPRQGTVLAVSGAYADLQRFISELETSLPALRWGELRLNAGAPGEPPVLSVQLWLAGAPS